jgi:23S rRNA (cytosine1962-C5)-methyltransferase
MYHSFSITRKLQLWGIDEPATERPRAPRLRLRVTAAAESILRGGHPWLFADSIRAQNRDGVTGELAVVYDRNDTFLAVGLFDAESPIRVRVLHAGKPLTIDHAWWAATLDAALGRRTGVFDDQTTGYRWINGESDGWPGLVLDRYAGTLVMKLYSAAWLPRVAEVARLICERLRPDSLVLRLSRNIASAAREKFSLTDGQVLAGATPAEAVRFLESGLRFEADVLRGQKTGFFLDQRENRRRVETLAAGGHVLNAFSFSGGFSLYAARGGAASVTDLDISPHALNAARRNFALNGDIPSLAACDYRQVQTDAFEWLRQGGKGKFDVVILDPPSLAKRESERAGAVRAYEKLAAAGLGHLQPGGTLVACSCSAHVTASEFFEAVRRAARATRRRFEERETAEHAADHAATFAEARYLKAIYLRF